eukprot:3032944-Prymnesium_polylepis.2
MATGVYSVARRDRCSSAEGREEGGRAAGGGEAGEIDRVLFWICGVSVTSHHTRHVHGGYPMARAAYIRCS